MNSHELVLRHYIKYHLIYNIITSREQQRNVVTEREGAKYKSQKRECGGMYADLHMPSWFC